MSRRTSLCITSPLHPRLHAFESDFDDIYRRAEGLAFCLKNVQSRFRALSDFRSLAQAFPDLADIVNDDESFKKRALLKDLEYIEQQTTQLIGLLNVHHGDGLELFDAFFAQREVS